jgi:hypothetical protein
MQRLLFTALACLLSVSLSAQRLTESNLHSHITYCFEEYISLELTKNVVNLENGEKFFVEVRIEDVSWFHLNIFLIDGELQMIGSIIEGMIDADVFSNAAVARSGFWEYYKDDDGDLSFLTEVISSNYSKKSDLKMAVTDRYEALLNEISDESYLNDMVDMNAVKSCEDAINMELQAVPYEFRQYVKPYDFCYCIVESFNEGGDNIYGALNPTSPEGKELLRGCFLDYCPECPSLGVSFEALFGAIDESEVKSKGKDSFVKACVRQMDNEGIAASFGQMEEYCNCAHEGLMSQGDSRGDLTNYFDPNSTETFELAAGCMHLLETEGESDFWNASSGITFCNSVVKIPLVEMNGGFYAKVQIGSESRYMLIDSGASEVLIDSEWAALLQQLGILSDYSTGSQVFSIADDSQVMVNIYEVSSLEIGGCSYSDFQVGVIEEGGMLLGMGFLGLFASWELDISGKQLILKK